MADKELETSIGSLCEVFVKGQDRGFSFVCLFSVTVVFVKIDFDLSFDTRFTFP